MTTSAPHLPHADRPRFFSGQLLTADDLTASQDVDTELRRLHHRMLHGWGIASGLVVSGRRGDVVVTVGAGYALDAAGRELVLADAVSVAVPAVTGEADGSPRIFALVLRWTSDDDAIVATRSGACGTEGAVRRSDAPTLVWQDPARVAVGVEVALADVAVQACRLTAPPDPTARRLLNPPPTPYTASGRTRAGETVWSRRDAQGLAPWGVETSVDTSEAGFGDTPAYLARVVGPREVTAAQAPHGAPCMIDGTPYVVDAEPGRFRLVVPLRRGLLVHPTGHSLIDVNPDALVGAAGLGDLLSFRLRWTVEWIGVQS